MFLDYMIPKVGDRLECQDEECVLQLSSQGLSMTSSNLNASSKDLSGEVQPLLVRFFVYVFEISFGTCIFQSPVNSSPGEYPDTPQEVRAKPEPLFPRRS